MEKQTFLSLRSVRYSSAMEKNTAHIVTPSAPKIDFVRSRFLGMHAHQIKKNFPATTLPISVKCINQNNNFNIRIDKAECQTSLGSLFTIPSGLVWGEMIRTFKVILNPAGMGRTDISYLQKEDMTLILTHIN